MIRHSLIISAFVLGTSQVSAQNASWHPDNKTISDLRPILAAAIEKSESFENRFDAEVWLVDMSARLRGKIPDPAKRLRFLRLVHQEARQAKLYPELVLAVIDVESNFDQYAISPAGAMGLMQVMPFWLKEIGRNGDNLFKPTTNLRMGCTILRYYMDVEKNDLMQALARYNGSKGSNRYSNKVIDTLNQRWRKY